MKIHQRRRKFDLVPCTDWAERDSISVIIFLKDWKLRSHAIKHFTNMMELDEYSKITRYNIEDIVARVDSLREIGCPFFRYNAYMPPCRRNGQLCHLWDKCTKFTERIEKLYLDIIEYVIEEAGKIPRYALYNARDHVNYCCMIPNLRLVAKLSWIPEYKVYNVMTCYQPITGIKASWNEIRDYAVRRIKKEAGRSVTWCAPDTWGFMQGLKKVKRERSKSHRRRQFRGRRMNS